MAFLWASFSLAVNKQAHQGLLPLSSSWKQEKPSWGQSQYSEGSITERAWLPRTVSRLCPHRQWVWAEIQLILSSPGHTGMCSSRRDIFPNLNKGILWARDNNSEKHDLRPDHTLPEASPCSEILHYMPQLILLLFKPLELFLLLVAKSIKVIKWLMQPQSNSESPSLYKILKLKLFIQRSIY